VERHLAAHLEAALAGRCEIVWSVAAAADVPLHEEHLEVTVDGRPVAPTEVAGPHGARLHRMVAEGSRVVFDYRAEVDGRAPAAAVDPVDPITYLRPSRYCESDRIGPTAWQQFAGRRGQAAVAAVTDWVHDRISYVGGSSRGTDSAVDTLLARRGVCRDFGHLTIALLRALNVPARYVSCWAPGLRPMEFHAVVEAYVDDRWVLLDPTRKAPRESMVRIATGRDAADTAFITNRWATLTLDRCEVSATTAGPLPTDDHHDVVTLA